MSRSLNVGFCQLHFPSSLLERRLADEARPPGERVPSEAAEAMERRMEPPEPGRNAWERFSFSVRTFQGERGERVKVGTAYRTYGHMLHYNLEKKKNTFRYSKVAQSDQINIS